MKLLQYFSKRVQKTFVVYPKVKKYYWCPIKLFLENKKLGLVPFGGISPFWLFWFCHKLL